MTITRVAILLAGVVALGGAALRADPPARTPKFDKDRLYLYQLQDFTRLKIGGGDRDVEHQAYCDLAIHAHSIPESELADAARKDVAYSNLMAADDRLREDVRFELIQVEGRLKRLKRIGTFPQLKEAGIGEVYEAWVFPHDSANPVCVHLTDPPAGIEPELDINPGKPVRACGYFFKVIQYQSEEPNPKSPGQNLYRRAPLLIGRGLELTVAPPGEPTGAWATTLLPVLFIGVGVVIVAIFAMSVWLRRSDVGARKYTARAAVNPFDGPKAETDGA